MADNNFYANITVSSISFDSITVHGDLIPSTAIGGIVFDRRG